MATFRLIQVIGQKTQTKQNPNKHQKNPNKQNHCQKSQTNMKICTWAVLCSVLVPSRTNKVSVKLCKISSGL